MKKTEETQKVLIVSKHGMLIDVVSVFLEGLYESTIEVADTSLKVDKLFESGQHRTIDLLLVEDERILGAAGKSLADFFKVQTIYLGDDAPVSVPGGRKLVFLKKPLDLDRLVDAIKAFAESQSAAPKLEYCRVRLETLFLAGKTIEQDVYVMNGGVYELAIHAGEEYSPANPKHFELRKQKFLYMKFADFTSFLGSFTKQLQSLVAAPGNVVDVGTSTNLSAGVHELLYQTIPELGFTPELQEATKLSMDLALNAIKRDSRLAELFETLAGSQSEYLTWHSVALCSVACRISNLMTWDSANTHYKLSLAAFLHDITVRNPDLARVRTLAGLNVIPASDEDKEEFVRHPLDAAALAREMQDFPGDVDHILAQHHEQPSGKGFPLGINHVKISPLAAVFIVAHDITDELYDQRSQFKLSETIGRLQANYTQGYFKKVIEALAGLARKEGSL